MNLKNMIKGRNGQLIKNTVIIGFGQMIPKVIAVMILPLLTKGFSAEQFGIYDLIISMASLALPVISLFIQQGAFRFLISAKTDEERKIIISNTWLFMILTIFVWGLALIPLLYIKLGMLSVFIYFLYLSETIYDVAGQISRGLGKNVIYSLGTISYSVINMVLLMIFLYTKVFDLNHVILASALAYLTGFFIVYLSSGMGKYVNLSEKNGDTIRELMSYSVPIIPSSISLWIVNLSDRLIIISILGSGANGIYAAANKIPNLLGSAYSVFNLAWTESASRAATDDDREDYYSKLYLFMFNFLTVMVLVIIAFSSILFKLLIDDKFIAGYNQMPVLSLGIMFSCLVSFYGGIYVALQQTKAVGLTSIIGAVLNLLINVLLISKIGIFAASLSTVISYYAIYLYRKKDIAKFISIKYNTIIIARNYAVMGLAVFLFYLNRNWTQILLYIISLSMAAVLFKQLLSKRREKQ